MKMTNFSIQSKEAEETLNSYRLFLKRKKEDDPIFERCVTIFGDTINIKGSIEDLNYIEGVLNGTD